MTSLMKPAPEARFDGLLDAQLDHALGQLHLSAGRYGEARVALLRAADAGAGGVGVLPDVVEASARSGHREEAERSAARLEVWARADGGRHALGLLARAKALLASSQSAEALYRRSIAGLEAAGDQLGAARSRLLYGEWLRRQRRRREARLQLRAAMDVFESRPSRVFADRARNELVATSEVVRKRSGETANALTSREAQVAYQAAQGQTNQEIGAQLCISPATVDSHLRSVFRKLGLRSRRQLRSQPLVGV